MKYPALIVIERVVEYLEKNELPPAEAVAQVRAIVDREKAILKQRAAVSKDNLIKGKVKYMP